MQPVMECLAVEVANGENLTGREREQHDAEKTKFHNEREDKYHIESS
jgi:hypothetical protein